jgi:hypothetical protein
MRATSRDALEREPRSFSRASQISMSERCDFPLESVAALCQRVSVDFRDEVNRREEMTDCSEGNFSV